MKKNGHINQMWVKNMTKGLVIIAAIMAFVACGNSKEKYDAVLQKAVNEANANLPMTFGNGMVWTSCTLDENNVNYNYQIDENYISLSDAVQAMKTNRQALITAMSSAMDNAGGKEEFKKALKETNRKIAICLETSSHSGRTVAATISPDEL